jgi:hypothetical protein
MLGSSFKTNVAKQQTTSGGVIGGYSYQNGFESDPISANAGAEQPIRRYTGNETGNTGEVRYEGFNEQDAERIRQETATRMKGELDAIEERYTNLAAQEVQTGLDRSGRTRALMSRSGLMGSGRGDAQSQKTENLNKDSMKALMAEKGAEIQSAYGRIDERSRQAVADARTIANDKRDEYQAGLKARRDEARADLDVFGAGGMTADELDPQDLTELMRDSGLGSKFLVEAYLNGKRPEGAKTNYQYKTVGNKIIAYGVNAQGELVTMEDELPFSVPEGYKSVATDDGRFVFIPENIDPSIPLEEQVMIYGAEGEFSKPGDQETEQLYSGLSSPTATAVRAKVNAFKSEKAITNFSTLQEGYQFAKSMDPNTRNPSDDQALIYAFAKAMDPDSVVREGEYATVQKYSQSLAQSYGKGITQAIAGTGFLSRDARANIIKTIETKYNASKKQYDTVYGNYQQSINSLTGRDDGEQFLTDYTTKTSVMATGPDGTQYEFDADSLTDEERQTLIDEGYTIDE